ncbi:hypothetical protein JXA48_03870 [Candidatus Woesearchaeota archaeon]|nr:hypothetical protein [Candidatus Woesearchaeota archaeon]
MGLKKAFWKTLTIGSLALAPLFANGQDIQGYVTDKNSGQALENIIVEAISQNDTTKRKDTLTDFSGFYELKDIVTGINDIPGFSGDKMTITYEGGQMRINVTTNQNIENGHLYNMAGQTISGTQFQRVGSNEFQATMNIPNVPEQVLLFSDGVHPAKKIIPGMLPSYGMQTIEFDKSSENNNGQKSARMAENNNFIFRLDDAEEVDEYQPLEIVKSVDLENTNYFDFEMQKWPEFFANMFFNLEDKYGNIQKNTNMNVNSLDGQYSFNITTDNNGDAQITDIAIKPIEGNKLIPDSVDFAVEIPANDYLEMARDTLWKVSQGDIIKNYHNLTPKQQEFFANLYATIVSEQTGNPLNNVLAEMWKENSTDTLKLFSNEQGQVSFENISIDAFNEITPDTLKHFLRFSGIDLEDKLDSINLTNGNFNQTYQITEINNPQPKEYTLVINSQDGEGNNLPGVNWLVLSSDSVLIGQGNTGSNSLDTLLFQDLNANKNIILKSNLNEHSDYRLETNLTAETIENRITENQLLTYLYELVINSQDGEGNNLPGVNWLVLSSDSTLIGSGNTGNNSLDTLTFQDVNTNKNIILKSNLDEHSDYRLETNLTAETIENRITENQLLTYLYELGVVGKDSASGIALDSVDVKAFLNGQLLMSGNSLQDTITNLQTTMPGHTLDLKLLMERAGYIKSDSIPISINEGVANELVYELVKEEVPPTEYKGVIRTRFNDPLMQSGTTADFIFTNNTLGVADTIFNVLDGQIITDTVLVNETGNTTYTLKVIPKTIEGNIPIYPATWTKSLSANQTVFTEPTLTSLEQEFVLKGERKTSDNGDAGELEVIFTETDGTVYSTTTVNGEYRLGPFPVGITGDIDFVVQGANVDNYFSHDNIPVGGTYNIKMGTVPVKDKLTNFKDTVLIYNPNMIQKSWTYPVNDSVLTINKDDLRSLQGSTYNAPWSYWNELRVYNTPNSDNPDWPVELGNFIQTHTGLPYNIIVVDTPRASIGVPQVDLNDPEYMESVRDEMGINAESVTDKAGITDSHSGGFSNNLGFNSTADITFTCVPQGQPASDIHYAIGMRELLGRFGNMSETSNYKSFMNGALASDITINDMIRDFANVNIIYKTMTSRTKDETHTGLGTLKE